MLDKGESAIEHELIARRAWDRKSEFLHRGALVGVKQFTDHCGSGLAPLWGALVDSVRVKEEPTPSPPAPFHNTVLFCYVLVGVPAEECTRARSVTVTHFDRGSHPQERTHARATLRLQHTVTLEILRCGSMIVCCGGGVSRTGERISGYAARLSQIEEAI
jgi:hypothetical protein